MTTLSKYEDEIPRLRIIGALANIGRPALLDVLHDPRFSNLPRDPKKLNVELSNNYKTNIDKLLKKKILKQEQWDLLFPLNQLTDSTKFDLTLCMFLIRNCTNLPPPTNGWKKPLSTDTSIAANVVRIVKLRNVISHPRNSRLTKAEFENFWNELETTINGLGHNQPIAIAHWKCLPLESLGQDTLSACYELFSEMNKQQQERNAELLKQKKYLVLSVFIILAGAVVAIGYILNRKDSSDIKRAANEASDSLRSKYIKEYRKKRFYIEPTIFDDTESITKQKRDISLKGLLDSYQHDILLLQGAEGIGKTSIMENTALQWARKEIWKDVDFLFLLKFRKLLEYRNLEESLIHSYQVVFKKITIDHLQQTNKKIVFLTLLDGLDEFGSFSITADQSTCNDSSVLSGIYELLNPDSMVFLHTIIVISCPLSTCQQLKSSFNTLFMPTLEVVGFNLEQVSKYLRRYFHHSQTDAETLKGIISSSDRLLMMSKVPAFLWTLCEFYQANSQLIKEKKTMTEQVELFVCKFNGLFSHWQEASFNK